MHTKGAFTTTVNVGGMRVKNFLVTVANVSTADGLLGMDFLHAVDTWIGTRNGTLHMTCGSSVLTYQLLTGDPRDRFTVNMLDEHCLGVTALKSYIWEETSEDLKA